MSTKSEVLERMAAVADDEIIAVPSIWTKEIAEELFEYSEGDSIALTSGEWREVVRIFEDSEQTDSEAMIEAIHEVIEDRDTE